MRNPFGSQQVPGSYVNLQKRMLQHMQDLKIDDQIFEVMAKAYDQALRQENVVLSSLELNRMLSQIMKTILEDMVKKLDKGSKPA